MAINIHSIGVDRKQDDGEMLVGVARKQLSWKTVGHFPSFLWSSSKVEAMMLTAYGKGTPIMKGATTELRRKFRAHIDYELRMEGELYVQNDYGFLLIGRKRADDYLKGHGSTMIYYFTFEKNAMYITLIILQRIIGGSNDDRFLLPLKKESKKVRKQQEIDSILMLNDKSYLIGLYRLNLKLRDSKLNRC